MNLKTLRRGAGILFLICLSPPVGASPSQGGSGVPLQPREGARIVFLGNALFEGAVRHGELEASLALRWPDKRLTFRNIGWSGDTVFGHSRTAGRRGSKFGTPEEGFERMSRHLEELKPDIVFVAYGFNESFGEGGGVAAFRQGMLRLLKTLGEVNADVVLLSPLPMEDGFGPSKGEVIQRNTWIKHYSEEIRAIAASQGHAFVDLFGSVEKGKYSVDGIHPSAEGYRLIAGIMAKELELPDPVVELDSEAADKLRSAIIAKNQLFFHRWRPRNDAFVFGERKDEQRIAQTEPAQIEPFIEKQEAIIRTLLETK